MTSTHNPHRTTFPKPEVVPVVFCPQTRLHAPRPHHMPIDEAHIYFDADSPECRECGHFGSCDVQVREAGFLAEASQSV